MASSRPFSATLALGLNPSRLQRRALIVLGAGAALPVLGLPLDLGQKAGWLLLVVAVAAVEHRRAAAGRRVRAIGRTGERWWLTDSSGRRFTGPLGAYWCGRHCAYLEIGGGWLRRRHLLVWRDAVSPAGYRDLCRHLRLSR